MSDTPELGKLPLEGAARDAIHVAIAPVVAAYMVYPAQRVGPMVDGRYGPHPPDGKHLGIVDPYLDHPVPAGASFWLCLFPGTVTGMRHHWSAPRRSPRPWSLHLTAFWPKPRPKLRSAERGGRARRSRRRRTRSA